MPYYCTVPQCTSMAGKTKNVSFHQFPRDELLAERWNIILKRNKPYTKYSKVCSRHFMSADYTMTHMGKNKGRAKNVKFHKFPTDAALAERWNKVLLRGKPYTKYSKVCSRHFVKEDYSVTLMGQWKTLNKNAIPSENLPRVNPDGSLIVLRKSRSPKHKSDDSSPPHSNSKKPTNGRRNSSQPSIATLAKQYMETTKTEPNSNWYHDEEEDEDIDNKKDFQQIKNESPVPERTVTMRDANIQTDACGPDDDPLMMYQTHSIFSGPGMTNFFQSAAEDMANPKMSIQGVQNPSGQQNNCPQKAFFSGDVYNIQPFQDCQLSVKTTDENMFSRMLPS